MNYKIIQKSAFTVIEKISFHTTENGENTGSVPAFWDACYADGSVKELESLASDFTYMYGICYDNPDKSEKRFAYSIAVESEKKAPAGYRKTVIPARTQAVFPCKGSVSHSIADFWAKTFPEFARNADYRSLREMDIEAYPDGDTDSEEYLCEIWIAVTKK